MMDKESMQPTYKRQRFLLAFIRQLDTSTSTDLQKLVFLHAMKNSMNFYEFIPYKFGPYSFQLAEDVEILRRDGYLVSNGKLIKVVEKKLPCALFDIAVERGDNLIRKAYSEYPYYTINSEITERIFGSAEAECISNEKQKYCIAGKTLFTIGYEGRSIEAFINSLIQNGIRLLCDVRKNPLSRKFGFSKAKLKHIAESIGITYVHMPDLGIEPSKRDSLNSVEDYRLLFENYATTLPSLKPHLQEVYALLSTHTRIALMCYERDASMCHRHVIRDYITCTHLVQSRDL